MPADLAAGDGYRLVFVTAATRDATSPNIADYNAFVAAQAAASPELAALGVAWSAIASMPGIDARANTRTDPAEPSHPDVPVYLVTGERLADGNSDLWNGAIARAIDTDQHGASRTAQVWTGTDTSGGGFSPLGQAGGFSSAGQSDQRAGGWIQLVPAGQGSSLPLYAISATLEVPGEAAPVPEHTGELPALFARVAAGVLATDRTNAR